jgi:hypothetical protein
MPWVPIEFCQTSYFVLLILADNRGRTTAANTHGQYDPRNNPNQQMAGMARAEQIFVVSAAYSRYNLT